MNLIYRLSAPIVASVAVVESQHNLGTFTAFCAIGTVVGLSCANATGPSDVPRRVTISRALAGLMCGVSLPRLLHMIGGWLGWGWVDIVAKDQIMEILAGFLCSFLGYWVVSAALLRVSKTSEATGKAIGDAAMKGMTRVLEHKASDAEKEGQ